MTMKLGTAVWADQRDVAANHPYRDGTIWLGRAEDGTPIGYRDDRHVCLVSGTRAGKGVSYIVNNLCLWPGSVVVIDPKGENATLTAAGRGDGTHYCHGMGQAVHVLDPFEAAKVDRSYRSRFNPLDAIDPEDEEAIDEADRLADAIVVVRPDAKEPFWDESARQMVKGLILHVLTADHFEGRRNLVTLRSLVLAGDSEAVEALEAEGETDIPSAQAMLWIGVAHNRALNGLVAGIGRTYLDMLQNSIKEFEGVRQVVSRNTEFLDSPKMQRVLEASDFKLSELKTRPGGMSLYLSLPQRYMATHYRWLRMMISLTITEMEKTAGQPATGHRVLMLLDEFAGLQRMPIIESGVAQMAGYGVKLFFILQTLEQLKSVYKDNWETFLACSGLKVFFSLDDHFSRDYVSKLIGDTEVIRAVRSASDTSGESESLSESTGRSRSETSGRSSSRGSSTSEGASASRSHSESESVTRSSNSSSGFSANTSWAPSVPGGAFRWNSSQGMHTSHGSSEGSSQGWSESESEGRSWSRSRSDTEGTSHSEALSTSETSGKTTGTSRSSTSGASETIQRRRLLPPEEIGQMFARIEKRDHPLYPGLALVVISGEHAMAVRRIKYFEDLHFIGRFGPHPDHKFRAPNTCRLESPALAKFSVSWRLSVAEGAIVNEGDVLGYVCGKGPDGSEVVESRLPIKAPVRGRVTRVPKIDLMYLLLTMPHLQPPSLLPGGSLSGLSSLPGAFPGNLYGSSVTSRPMSTWAEKVPAILTYDEVTGLSDPFAYVIRAFEAAEEKRRRLAADEAAEKERRAQEAREAETAKQAASVSLLKSGQDASLLANLQEIQKEQKKLWWLCGLSALGVVGGLGLGFMIGGISGIVGGIVAVTGGTVAFRHFFSEVGKAVIKEQETKKKQEAQMFSSIFSPAPEYDLHRALSTYTQLKKDEKKPE